MAWNVLHGLGRIVCLTTLVGLLLGLASCATTRTVRSAAEPSGFLGDYSQLRPGTGKEAQLVYINPDANWAQYQAIILDSVTLWQDAETSKISAEDAQQLTDYFYAQLHEQLSQDYQIVEHPGPGVMRLRAAITEAKGAKVAGNAVTTVVPQLKLLTTAGGLATDTRGFVGEGTVEAEITDSVTGTRLAAAVDERAGTKAYRAGLKEWSHVKRAFEYWAKQTRERLAELRKGGA